MLLKKYVLFIGILFLFCTQSWANEESIETKHMDSPVEKSVETESIDSSAELPADKNKLTNLSKPIVVFFASPGFEIRLPDNAKTDHRWFLVDYNPRLVKLLGQKYISGNAKLGTPDMSEWEFQLQQIAFIAPQSTRIVLEYRRLAETKTIKRQTFVVLSTTERRQP
jgi:predicted secreted protein